ncbi:hypothetical protein DUI87_06974 [Hirundo rustica rustica]|uniref:Uncharacterized protein n=1 Tax=Hirundo rustica rustica TaxID=333673 RepID=A0A3M0KNI8_HIRRU|nr:hypothetical protein DUI87_06974 [Hirundo rustica rustica]
MQVIPYSVAMGYHQLFPPGITLSAFVIDRKDRADLVADTMLGEEKSPWKPFSIFQYLKGCQEIWGEQFARTWSDRVHILPGDILGTPELDAALQTQVVKSSPSELIKRILCIENEEKLMQFVFPILELFHIMLFAEFTIHITHALLRGVSSPSDLLDELFLDSDLTQFSKNGTDEFKNSLP